jgi:nitrogen fixation NifU-like protein
MYRQTVLDHSRHPRNFRRLERADRTVEGHNPLCGDKLTVYLRLADEKISDIAFEGTGCAISLASASIMTESLVGESIDDARTKVCTLMHSFETRDNDAPPIPGDMAALGGVRQYPARIKCATLAWKALAAGLQNDTQTVTTES